MQSNDICKYCKYYGMDGVEHCFVDEESNIFNFEGIEVEPVRNGHWIKNSGNSYTVKCSRCKAERITSDSWFKYCPNCGAKMKVE